MGGPTSLRLHRILLIAVVIIIASSFNPRPTSATDVDALLDFKNALSGDDDHILNWRNVSSSPCIGNHSNWTGVICANGVVLGLQLESMGLSGELKVDHLSRLSGLRTLSFMNNSFEGTIPEIKKLGALKFIYLSLNDLSGVIPDDAFSDMRSLKKVYLSSNRFVGPIPTSLARLPKLLEARLDGNGFTGNIPDFNQPELKLVNVSNNDLEGPVPDGVGKDASLVRGNKNLCGPLLGVKCPSSKKHLTPLTAVIIVIGVVAVLALVGGIFVVFRFRRLPSKGEALMSSAPSPKKPAKNVEEDQPAMRLVFVKGEYGGRFDLQDLLKASAEVMGGGLLGSSYKASMLDGATEVVVVKRFKEMNAVGRVEFEEHMRRLGRLSHPNLLPLIAYYHRREEKLLVTAFHPAGSLANQLHGNNHMLDWPTRLKIVKGVARGLAYLYNALPMLSLPHGDLKSSNVILRGESLEPLLSDYAFAPLMNHAHATQVMAAYKAPEYAQQGRASKKSDVWSFGILILEILTGKLPESYVRPGGKTGSDLASWVNSVIREEWTGEVFDGRMRGGKNCEGEMLKLLKIGLSCCERELNKRSDMIEALEKVEGLKERAVSDEDYSYYSSYMSDGDFYSSKVMTEDEFSFAK